MKTQRFYRPFTCFLLVWFMNVPLMASHQETGTTFNASGVPIYVEVTGSGAGTPLVVVNGGPGFDHTYLHESTAWDTLAASRRVVMYDQRGTGRSKPVPADHGFTLKDQINDLEAVRQHLGAEQIDLLGHSWGGFLVMAYAAMYPQHIAHLIIVDSAAPVFRDTIFLFDRVFPEGTEREKGLAFAINMGDQRAVEANLKEYLSMLFYSPEKRDAFLKDFSMSAYDRKVNQAVVQDISRFDLNPELRKFHFPTLVITGRFDMNVAPRVAYSIHEEIPGSQFQVFERSGHMPFYEEPDAFVKSVQEFLSH